MSLGSADITLARSIVTHARAIMVLTGAGISTDSGIPDFRGPEGVWTRDPAAERLSTIDTYLSEPEVRIMSWRRWVENQESRPRPNPAHRALVKLEERSTLLLLVTQNTDGLHLEAGHDLSKVVEIHGSGRRTSCVSCGATFPTTDVAARVRGGEADPHCREFIGGDVCGGILKRATVLFGEPLVPGDIQRAEEAARACDALLAIGTTLSVWPAAGLVPAAASHGSRIVIVNGDPTGFDDIADAVVREPIGASVPAIVG